MCRAPNRAIRSTVSPQIKSQVYRLSSKAKKEEYQVTGQEAIIIVENQDLIRSPVEIIASYLPFHLHLITFPKSRKWYEAIMIDIELFTFSHKMRNATQIACSSIKVQKILSYTD